jgi:hypothetical protein
MTPREKINREVMNVVGSIKDNVASDLVLAVQQGKLVLEEKQLKQVISLVSQLVDASYYRSNRSLMRSVDAALEAAATKPRDPSPKV